MTGAKHTPTGRFITDCIAFYGLDRAFRSVRYFPEGTDRGLPVLMLANHFSWWDGFIQHRLNLRYFGRRAHVMMLEEQLRRYPVLKRCGAFSVRKNTPDVVRSLHYASALLEDSRNLVLLFPQGKLSSIYADPIDFQSGARYLLGRLGDGVQVVFNVNLPDYGPHARPALSVYVKACGPVAPRSLAEAFKEYYRECKARQSEAWKL